MKALQMAVYRLKTFWKRAWWSKIVIVIICLGLALYFWPFLLGGTLSLLILRRIKAIKLRWLLIIFIVVVTLFFGSAWFSALVSPSRVKNDSIAVSTPTQKPIQPTQAPQVTANPTPTPSQTTVSVPTPTPTITPTPELSFDKKMGNNYVAAQEAKRMFDILNNASPGFIKSVRIDLSPEEVKGSEDEYKAKLISVYLTIEVNSALWSSTNESSQKDLAVSFLNAITKIFGGIQHVRINNGIRDVAKADWSFFGDKANVELY